MPLVTENFAGDACSEFKRGGRLFEKIKCVKYYYLNFVGFLCLQLSIALIFLELPFEIALPCGLPLREDKRHIALCFHLTCE